MFFVFDPFMVFDMFMSIIYTLFKIILICIGIKISFDILINILIYFSEPGIDVDVDDNMYTRSKHSSRIISNR